MKAGRFLLSTQLLCDVLNLPPGTEISTVMMQDDYTVEIAVTHDDFPDVAIIDVPILRPIFRRVTSSAVEFQEWGTS
jgi:hypothetical protein